MPPDPQSDAEQTPLNTPDSSQSPVTGPLPAPTPAQNFDVLPTAQPASYSPVSASPTVITPSEVPTPDAMSQPELAAPMPFNMPTAAGQTDIEPSRPVVSFHTNTIDGTSPFSDAKGQQKKRRFPKKILFPIIILILLGGGAFAYFGYYMSSNYVWKESLGHMNGGYSKLIGYLNTRSATHYKGVRENGSFKVTSGSSNYDGSLAVAGDGSNSTVSAKFDYGLSNFDFEERGITAAGASDPDVYVQLNGIKEADSLLGDDFGPQIDSLDGQWIEIDHNLIGDLKNIVAKQQVAGTPSPQLTWAEINSFLQAAGKVDQQYVFTTNKNTAVTTVLKSYGKETIDGHKTYHYKVGFVKAHVKAYVTAMCSALQQSDLGNYLKQETGQAIGTSSTCKDLESSAGQIKSSDTVDVWADINTRLLYKVRVSDPTNPAQSFVDIGLNYKGGNSYPFFISGQDKTGGATDTFSITTTLNNKSNAIAVGINAAEHGSDQFSLSGNFTVQPTNTKLVVVAPTNVEQLSTVLNNVGLGQYVTQLQSLGTNYQVTSTPFTKQPIGLLTDAVL